MTIDLMGLFTAPDRDAFLAELAKAGPVTRARYLDGTPVWLVSGYEESRAALTDPRLSSDIARQSRVDVAAAAGLPEDVRPYLMKTLGAYDPPDHTRLRRLVSREFTARRVELLRPRIQQIADELLDGLAGQEEADLIASFAYPLPVTVICELLGVPEADHDTWGAWSRALTAPDPDAIATGARNLIGYMAKLIEAKRADPGEDLLSALVQARDRLSDEEPISVAITILLAGHETTVNLIGNGALHLLTHPDQADRLRGDAAAMSVAVEELLRHSGPADIAPMRYTLEPVEIAGVVIPAGEAVQIVYATANRDPRRFADPDRLQSDRRDNPHLGFGHGIHYCLGAPLARAEAQIALHTLLVRLPRLRLAVRAEQITWRPGVMRALAALPVRP
ncbi:cytochrome P450 family protein [Nonomuraea sp. SYSU D8015]|uniref:cytochrome P450 family protein n=1 Tax=Nonomuraea sp. SYSU D8015 TaxID=2593644 RepID=UPI0016614045|nr:cytochrome P450 [Nonomuraea sp. SYSU D8015]